MIVALLLCVFLSLVTTQDLVLNRIRIVNNADNQASVRMHIQSRDLPLLHAVLRFSSNVNVQHSALLIAQDSLGKYRTVLDDVRHKILVNTRGDNKLLSYIDFQADNTTVGDANRDGVTDRLYELIQSTRLFGGSPSTGIAYDGVLLLDLYSGLWQEYNLAIFDHNVMRLRFTLDKEAEIAQLEREQSFNTHIRLVCNTTFQEDKCFVAGTETDGLIIDDVHYPLYRLLVDLDSPINRLPTDVYLRWYRGDASDTNGPYLNVSWQGGATLQLNRRFRYVAHESNLVILGADLLHFFPRIIYSVPEAYFDIYAYKANENDFDHHEAIAALLLFLNLLLLVCLFLWGTSYNYLLLQYIVRYGRIARSLFFFAHKQVLYEGGVIVIAIALIIVTSLLVGSDSADEAYDQRKNLLTLFVICHAVLLFLVMMSHVESVRCAFRHYFSCQCIHTKRRNAKIRPYWPLFASLTPNDEAEALYAEVVKAYHDPLVHVPTPLVIMRNLLFAMVNFASLALLLNFYTPESNLCLLVMMVLSLAQIFYHAKYLAIGVLFLSLLTSRRQWLAHRALILFMALETLALGLYVTFAYETIYVAYFQSVNSTYPRVVVDAYLRSLVTLTMYAAVFKVSAVFDHYADEKLDKVIYS